jgi:hypothetical protein
MMGDSHGSSPALRNDAKAYPPNPSSASMYQEPPFSPSLKRVRSVQSCARPSGRRHDHHSDVSIVQSTLRCSTTMHPGEFMHRRRGTGSLPLRDSLLRGNIRGVQTDLEDVARTETLKPVTLAAHPKHLDAVFVAQRAGGYLTGRKPPPTSVE